MKMKTNSLYCAVALALAFASGQAVAAGPLYTHTIDSNNPQPYKWDTSRGPIPVYTDGGGAFTYNTDGSVFLSIEQANAVTAFAMKQWSDVPTATFEATVQGTIADKTGIADVTAANADQVYGAENGYGFWVVYDTDGTLLESVFGVPKTAVLGIAFPEWANEETGEILEATALMNGWNVHVTDTQGSKVAGVFTHEFGHAINLSHSQVNGPLAYQSTLAQPKYPGVKGCVAPQYRYDYPAGSLPAGAVRANPAHIETMFPFISHTGLAGQLQSTVDMADDIASISNLYPTADYATSRGAIAGVLRLKDGRTDYSGINVVARNVANPTGDAVSAMTGDQTQGKIGPDGRFTIRNLTPGQQYVVYIEEITAGGYPTTQQRLVSQGEYWNTAEGSSPASDLVCDKTPIVAEAGVTKTADITFNGYMQGIDYSFLGTGMQMTDLAKNGNVATGVASGLAVMWSKQAGFVVMPAEFKATSGSINRNGNILLGSFDDNGNGIGQMTLASSDDLLNLGDLTGDTCGGSNSIGKTSSYGWAVDDAAKTAVGTGYKDTNGDGVCQTAYKGEIVPVKWTASGGMRELDTHALNLATTQWVRAHAVSGNGDTVLGSINGSQAVAWYKGGDLINLYTAVGARDAYASNAKGSLVALSTYYNSSTRTGGTVKLWTPAAGTGPAAFTDIGALAWCVDAVAFHAQLGNMCTHPAWGPAKVQAQLGPLSVQASDMSDDGKVIIGRAGSGSSGYMGAIWIAGMGRWMGLPEFFRKQGVTEAFNLTIDNPISISASGSEIVGGLVGIQAAWHVNIDQVFVCEKGASVQTGFPNGLIDKLAAGARFGRCEFQ